MHGDNQDWLFIGVIAQLGERYNGIVEVGGSIPPGSTREVVAHLCQLFWCE